MAYGEQMPTGSIHEPEPKMKRCDQCEDRFPENELIELTMFGFRRFRCCPECVEKIRRIGEDFAKII
jgi:hypothetical protein